MSLSPKGGPTTKGQAGDGPELAVPSWAPGTQGTDCKAELELEKVRMEFELTRLRYLHEENERQRQHEEMMEQLQQQATPRLVGDREGVGGTDQEACRSSPKGQGLILGIRDASVPDMSGSPPYLLHRCRLPWIPELGCSLL